MPSSSILPFVAAHLGTAVAKGVLKFWLKDREIASQVTLSVTEILGKKVVDWQARRALDLQFIRIGDHVAQMLTDLLESEGADISESAKESIILAAEKAIEKTPINPAFLADKDLEPAQLAQAFLTNCAELQHSDFSLSEKSLLERVALETSQYIIDIASRLPSFSEHIFGEILQRETLLLDRAKEILTEVRRIKAGLIDPNSQASKFESDYRRTVARKLDQIELFGVDVERSRRYPLSIAYISLSLDKSGADDTLSHGEERQTFIADKVLQHSRRLIIRGPAGSGKSTLLKWIAVRCASNDMPGLIETERGPFPLFVKLRHATTSTVRFNPKPEDLIAAVAPMIAGQLPAGWIQRKLETGQTIILLDGLDEISTPQRAQLETWVREVLAAYPQVYLAITTRPHAAPLGFLSDLSFLDVSLQEMHWSDIYSFVEQWHVAVSESCSDEEKASLVQNSGRLLGLLKTHSALRRLATSPLLCAMLCALSRERVQELPRDRVELYRICIDMFLRRDIERGIPTAASPDLSAREKLALLEHFSYWMMRNNLSEATVEQTDRQFDLRIQRLHELKRKRIRGETVRISFVERLGILRQPSLDVIDFPHRTLQEFLAASEALVQDDIDFLVKNAHDASWRETVVLACGRARAPESRRIVTGLLDRASAEPQFSVMLILLAAMCLDVTPTLEPEVTNGVRQVLVQVVPPQNMTDAASLAGAGELVVPYLQYVRRWTATEAACAIRTLSRVGGSAAVSALEAYGQDERQGVVRELLRAIDDVDAPANFAARVLSRSRCKTLTLSRNANLLAVSAIHSLEMLNIDFALTQDLSPILSLLKLRRLHIRESADPTILSKIASIQSLRFLSVGWSALKSELRIPTVLSSLSLDSLRLQLQAATLDGIQNIPSSLTELNISVGVVEPSVFCLPPLARLQKLTFSTSDAGHTLNLSGLVNSAGLSHLSISSASTELPTTGVENLKALRTLRRLILQGISTESHDWIFACTSLRTLVLRRIPGLKEWRAASEWTSLEILELSELPDLVSCSAFHTCRRLLHVVLRHVPSALIALAIENLPARARLYVTVSSVKAEDLPLLQAVARRGDVRVEKLGSGEVVSIGRTLLTSRDNK